MATRFRTHPVDRRRAFGALLSLLALVCAVAAFVYALSSPGEFWAWAAVSGCVFLTGIGAQLSRQHR